MPAPAEVALSGLVPHRWLVWACSSGDSWLGPAPEHIPTRVCSCGCHWPGPGPVEVADWLGPALAEISSLGLLLQVFLS